MSRVLPILFNTDMVQAILDGKKMATRRICKDGNDFNVPDMTFYDADKRTYAVHNYADKAHTDKLSIAERTCQICPGDILYVRETYCPNCFDFVTQYGNKHGYKADYDRAILLSNVPKPKKWVPSIHMPKQAARIWLKVMDVRVERLQDIKPEDLRKEGMHLAITPNECKSQFNKLGAIYLYEEARENFSKLWDSTLKKSDLDRYGWDVSPWVWVIEFERCEKPEPCIIRGGEPADDERPCIGYSVSEDDDEPCEMCKGCKICTGNEEL